MVLHQVYTCSCDDGYLGAYMLCSPLPPAERTVQMPALTLHESSRAPQDLQALQHIFPTSDLYLSSKACLRIRSHMLYSPGANT